VEVLEDLGVTTGHKFNLSPFNDSHCYVKTNAILECINTCLVIKTQRVII